MAPNLTCKQIVLQVLARIETKADLRRWVRDVSRAVEVPHNAVARDLQAIKRDVLMLFPQRQVFLRYQEEKARHQLSGRSNS